MSATRLYLHIGRNKTGSTSLQNFCAAHAEFLARHGVRYALLGHLADPASGLPSFADQRQLADFVRGCGARAVFASNEMFTGFSPEILRSAAADLAALDVQIMLYMRPYAPWLRSCYSYDTRIGVNGRDFDSYARHTQPLVSIWPPLAIWGEVLGWDRLRVRTTEAADLLGGEIIADCLDNLGVPLPADYAPVRSNTAPHWIAIELLRLVVGADEALGWTAPGSLAIAQALHELADDAIAATGHSADEAIYTTRAQTATLSALYTRDIAQIGASIGWALAPAPSDLPPDRAFLPSAAHVPPAVIAHISQAAQRRDFARLHPEAAAFVRAGPFAALQGAGDRLAPARAGTYLRQSGVSGAIMASGVAEMVRQDAAHAHELAGEGNLASAIALGTRLVRTSPDLDLLAAMAEWRRDAFGRIDHPPGPGTWPPHYPDPFPHTVGIPEIGAAELTAEVLGGAILHHGSLRVNGLVPPETVAALRAGIDRALVAQETSNNERPTTDPGWYRKLDVPSLEKAREWSQGCGAVWTADCPPMLDATIEALRASGALECIAAFMGERPALSVAKSTLRRVSPGGYHDWHQDGAFLGRDVRSVNVWLALSECGETAPGMDIVGKRLPYVMPTLSHGACFDWTVGQGFVDILAEGGAPVVTPVFGPGDALLFDHLMLHRTSLKAGMVGQRWAIESWFFAPTNYPYDQVPLYV